MQIKRGDIVLVNLNPTRGSEQGKKRPAVVIQNNLGNQYSPTTIIAPITSKIFTKEFPTNVQITPQESSLEKPSTILLNQIRTIDKLRIIKKIATITDELTLEKITLAIKISLAIS